MRVGLLANIKPASTENIQALGLPTQVAGSSKSTANFEDLFAEWDSAETVDAVRSALASHPEVECETIEAIPSRAIPKLQEGEFDIIFNLAEGLWGEAREAQFPALLEMLGIPYTGSGPRTLSAALDKGRTKEILSYNGIPTPRFATVHREALSLGSLMPGAEFPVIVKPVSEGSSKGIRNSSFVQNEEALNIEILRITRTYGQAAIIEEFLPGREFTVAVLGSGERAYVLPIVEINFKELPKEANPIYSYEAKWVFDVAENPLDIFQCPAALKSALRSEIECIVLQTYSVLECRDWARIDVRLDARGRANIIEVNPLPGILPNPEENSCYPKAARAAGLSYEDMLLSVLKSGCDRYNIPFDFQPAWQNQPT